MRSRDFEPLLLTARIPYREKDLLKMDQDSKAIIATEGPGSTALALEPELAEALNEVIAAAKSDNTRRAYAAQVAKFEAWCARRRSALPATPAVVAIYLTDLAATGADPSKPAKG